MDINAFLKRYQPFGVHLGLERIQCLLANLDQPQQRVPVIHVAGSNGKGSVCAYLSAVLTEAGYRVGRFISPHLVDWTERLCVNEQAIAPETLAQILLQVEAAIRPEDPTPTQFELLTAAAWWYFAQQQVDVAVMEVGLGGRLDATNVCDRPLVSVITSLSREHWQILGPTLADIAREKAGILKPGCPAVIGPLPAAAKTVVEQRLRDLGCPAFWPPPARLLESPPETPCLRPVASKVRAVDPRGGAGWRWAEAQGICYPLPLPGEIQLTNSALAIATVRLLQQQGWQVPDRAIIQGMARTRWPGRMQWLNWRGQNLLVDGAHNPAAAVALRQFVDARSPGATTWVMGMLATKDHREIFQALLRPGDRLLLVPVPDHSTADPAALALLATQVCPDLSQCQTFADLHQALEAACQEAALSPGAATPLMVLCGSLYLVGQLLQQVAGAGGSPD